MIHLDASFLIDLMRERRRRPGPAHAWLEQHAGDQFGVSVFVVCEAEAGAVDAADPETERARLRDALQTIVTIYPDERFAPSYAKLLSQMQRRGRLIGTMDTLIATIAVVENVPLVTGNEKHFAAVPDLRVLSYR